MTRRFVFAVLLCLSWLPALAADKPKKVVVIGFDGADPGLVQTYMDQGLLPHLKHLSEQGKFTPLNPTNPPQTPVSWSAFATGLNPGRTEIFDFLQRDKGTYTPDFALVRRLKKTFLFGENNGLVVALSLGAVLAVLSLVTLGVLAKRWKTAAACAAVLLAGTTFGLKNSIATLLPVEVPDGVNARQGTPFWTIAANHGSRVKVTHVPVTFPAEEMPAGSNMISGLGVPDMRGRVGSPTIWTTDRQFETRRNEFSLTLDVLPARSGPVESTVLGPTNYPFNIYVVERARDQWKKDGLSISERAAKEKELKEKLRAQGYPEHLDTKVRFDIGPQSVAWSVGDQSGTLKVGEWSDWVIFDFRLNALVDKLQPLRGMSRFRLNRLDDQVEIYLAPVNFHPSCHPVRYSWPPDWAEELSAKTGLFKTIGWQIDTWTLPTGFGGLELFAEDMWHTVDLQQKILDEQLGQQQSEMYVQVFDFPDRAGHMLWHQLDDGHPLHKPETAEKYRVLMKDVYVRMDAIVGRARELAGPDALFIVVSDHGFSSFRRQINLNTWLYKHGLLALKGNVRTRDLEQLFDKDVTGVNVFEGIDWSRTKAWAMGLGSIYINLVGREPQGIVMPGDDYEQIVKEIQTGLESELDPVTGLKPISRIYRRDELYHDYDPGKLPDLRAANILNYRVSWQDTLGGLSTDVFEDNDRTWSGDHCSLDPKFVPGILFVNRKLTVDDPSIMDIAPSILNELALQPDVKLDGRVVWQPQEK